MREPRAACWVTSQGRLWNQTQPQLGHLELSYLGAVGSPAEPHFLR